MSGQIIFFKKSKCDYTTTAVATASQGSSFAPYVQNRSNLSGWLTTGSVDADNTTFTMDLVDTHTLTDIILVKHNFKNFNIKWWDGAAYQSFSPAISVSGSTQETSRFSFSSTQTSKIQITILGTQVANSDKVLYQLILTELIGQLAGWPIIKKPELDRNLRNTKMLSGKTSIGPNVGAFSCVLSVKNWRSDADLTVVEALFGANDGFLVWLSGGDETQFSSVRQGYRLEDLFLMRCTNPYSPEWSEGLYKTGVVMNISLTEVTT